jgi:saccharopine dehydrogenase (NADP+, L-glutamate forming)
MSRNILVLGAGLVARPLVRYLLEQPDLHVTVASRTLSRAEALVGGHPRGRALAFDIEADRARLDELLDGAGVAISMLPYIHHVQVAEACLRHACHLITTSYVSNAMRALDGPARESDVLLLNEIGLDPGIDHMTALRVIHRVHQAGGQIAAFRSFCGGLPAPEANDNPLGYKFSWSPRGVVLAGRNSARYREHGRIVEVPNARLFATHFVTWVEGLGDLEAYPNRDALPYLALYGIPEAETIYRGTLRNLGWCDVMQKLHALGYFSLDPRSDLAGKTCRQVLAERIGRPDGPNLRAEVAAALNVSPASGVMQAIEWLGLLSDEPAPDQPTLLDALAELMLARMAYRAGERDMVVLVHEFEAIYPAQGGARHERITSTLLDFGVPGGR